MATVFESQATIIPETQVDGPPVDVVVPISNTTVKVVPAHLFARAQQPQEQQLQPATHIAVLMEISRNSLQAALEQSRQRELDRAHESNMKALELDDREKQRAHEQQIKQAEVWLAQVMLKKKKRTREEPASPGEQPPGAEEEDTESVSSAASHHKKKARKAAAPTKAAFDMEGLLRGQQLHPPSSRSKQYCLSSDVYQEMVAMATVADREPPSAVKVFSFVADAFNKQEPSLPAGVPITPHCVAKKSSTLCALWAPEKHRQAVQGYIDALVTSATAALVQAKPQPDQQPANEPTPTPIVIEQHAAPSC